METQAKREPMIAPVLCDFLSSEYDVQQTMVSVCVAAQCSQLVGVSVVWVAVLCELLSRTLAVKQFAQAWQAL